MNSISFSLVRNLKRFVPESFKGSLRQTFPRLGEFFPDIRDFEGHIGIESKDQTDLQRIFYDHDGPLIHKWTHYLEIYEQYLTRYRGTEARLLEIGVSKGGSLALWRKFLGPKATIFGIDIDERCALFNGTDGKVRIGSQADPQFLRTVVDEMGGIDVVIDDGSHVAEHQRISFEFLFPRLAPVGVYICEDLHTAYWPQFQGGYRRRNSFIEIAKSLVDDVHADFHARGSGLTDAERQIKGVHFYNSMVVIEKEPQARPCHVRVGTASF